MDPAALHVAKSFQHGLILARFDVFPELLAQDVNSVDQFFLGLLVADQVGELTAEPIVVLTIVIDLALLLTASTQVVNKLLLGIIETAAHSLTHVSQRVEFLHAFTEVLCKHFFPLGDFLTFTEFLDSLHEFGAAANALRSASNRVQILRQESLAGADSLHGVGHVGVSIIHNLNAVCLLRVHNFLGFLFGIILFGSVTFTIL